MKKSTLLILAIALSVVESFTMCLYAQSGDKYILAVDQGTSSSRAILFNKKGESCAVAQQEYTQIFPQSGWVEHDPQEIWSSESSVISEAMSLLGINGEEIAGIGITNQRETTIVWDAETGEPVYNAIVWQDRRTAEYCDELKAQGLTDMIHKKTGLIIDAYFSATKIKWILDNVSGARERAMQGKLRFGTVDTWLVWKLTNGKLHITDATNASRTMVFNIQTLKWDEDLLTMFGIPLSMMPEVKSSSEVYGYTDTPLFNKPVAIAGIAGDQQAALFGQLCTEPGTLKNTYGTGGFLLMNTGETPIMSKNNLLTTIALKMDGKVTYALEGSVFVAGSLVQWLRDGLGIIKSSGEVEELAASVPNTDGVYFVPALTGLGAPYWDQYARGSITGLSRGTTSAHIARAALEGIAFETYDILKAVELDAGMPVKELRVDGGASRNNLMMQFQADILNAKVVRPRNLETTALGATYLAGLAVGYWNSLDEIRGQCEIDTTFIPTDDRETVEAHVKGWQEAVQRTLTVGSSENEPGQGSFVWLTIKDGKSGCITLKTKKDAEQVLTIKPEEGWKVSSIVMNGNDVTSLLNEDNQFVTPIITSDASIIIVYEEASSAVSAISASRANIKVVDDGVMISNAEPGSRCVVCLSDGRLVFDSVIGKGKEKITLQQGQIYILTIDGRTLKFAL